MLLVAIDSVTNFSLIEHDGRLKPGHLVAVQFFRYISGLNLELHLGDLSEERYLISTARCEFAMLKQGIILDELFHSIAGLFKQPLLYLVEFLELLLS